MIKGLIFFYDFAYLWFGKNEYHVKIDVISFLWFGNDVDKKNLDEQSKNFKKIKNLNLFRSIVQLRITFWFQWKHTGYLFSKDIFLIQHLCLVYPIFLSFGFYYFGHFNCVIFFPFFCLAHLALQNVNKDYIINSFAKIDQKPKTKYGMNEKILAIKSDRISSQIKKKTKISKIENWKFLKFDTWNISHISSRLVNVSWVVWPSTYHKKNVDWWIAVMKGPWHTSIDLFLWCISNQGNLLWGIVNFSA